MWRALRVRCSGASSSQGRTEGPTRRLNRHKTTTWCFTGVTVGSVCYPFDMRVSGRDQRVVACTCAHCGRVRLSSRSSASSLASRVSAIQPRGATLCLPCPAAAILDSSARTSSQRFRLLSGAGRYLRSVVTTGTASRHRPSPERSALARFGRTSGLGPKPLLGRSVSQICHGRRRGSTAEG